MARQDMMVKIFLASVTGKVKTRHNNKQLYQLPAQTVSRLSSVAAELLHAYCTR